MKRIVFGILTLLFLVTDDGYSQQFGDWGTGFSKKGDFVYAVTVNDSKALLGQYCYFEEETCLWMLGMATGCEEGHRYPVLANSAAGSFSLEIYCTGKVTDKAYLYAFTNYDSVNSMISKGSMIGFAVPLLSDQFKVIRFSLIGANSATKTMISGFKKGSPKKTNTKDKIL